jgi:hypothetical protein
MDRTAPPAGEPHSVLGCSVGASQGDVLVIHTSLVNRPYLDQIGTPLSEHVQSWERYDLSDDQSQLGVEITITDADVHGARDREELLVRVRRHAAPLRLPEQKLKPD